MKYPYDDVIEYVYTKTKCKYEHLTWIVAKSVFPCYDLINVMFSLYMSIN